MTRVLRGPNLDHDNGSIVLPAEVGPSAQIGDRPPIAPTYFCGINFYS